MAHHPTIVWIRNNLRLHDNPALWHAAQVGPCVLVINGDDHPTSRPIGQAARWWRGQSIEAFRSRLTAISGNPEPLTFMNGEPSAALAEIAAQTGACNIYWNRSVEPAVNTYDELCSVQLRAQGLHVRMFTGDTLHEPASITTREGRPHRVFTPFWKALQKQPVTPPLPTVERLAIPRNSLPKRPSTTPQASWTNKLAEHWRPGELSGLAALETFLHARLETYAKRRDFPAIDDGTSRLSPWLAAGDLSPRTLWHATLQTGKSGMEWLRQLAWREFNYNLLHQFPDLAVQPIRREFERLTWHDDQDGLRSWQEGRTGIAIVDAGMRELWATGYMHNRVRMIAASFLTKDLMIPWQSGEQWFWNTLVDADPANNPGNWQWTAGCGADAAPYFRVFNPELQAERFDPDGAYTHKWLEADVGIPVAVYDRPEPIVDHAMARERALAAYAKIKSSGSGGQNEP